MSNDKHRARLRRVRWLDRAIRRDAYGGFPVHIEGGWGIDADIERLEAEGLLKRHRVAKWGERVCKRFTKQYAAAFGRFGGFVAVTRFQITEAGRAYHTEHKYLLDPSSDDIHRFERKLLGEAGYRYAHVKNKRRRVRRNRITKRMKSQHLRSHNERAIP